MEQTGQFLRPVLTDGIVLLRPLKSSDFDILYSVASDPEIWLQHPNPDRWKKEVFLNFFEGALSSNGAFLVTEAETGKVVGSTRFYDFDPQRKSIFIGYTFLGRAYWGRGYNKSIKLLMLRHIFNYSDRVYFHVGVTNYRSRRAMEKLGAEMIRNIEVAYYGEPPKVNVEYLIEKAQFNKTYSDFL